MNKKTNNQLPVFMRDAKTNEILSAAARVVPHGAQVYLVGGAARNAMYDYVFHKALPQRDYDISFYGDVAAFVKNLRKLDFTYGKIRRKHEITLKKTKVAKPEKGGYSDYVVFDLHLSDEKSILKNLQTEANFTINGFAIPLKSVASKDWIKKVVSLPVAWQDLNAKQIRVNAMAHPANLFACLRWMSQCFKAPLQADVKVLLAGFSKIDPIKYKRNTKKLFDYVGGEKDARLLLKKLKIKENLFDYAVVEGLKNK